MCPWREARVLPESASQIRSVTSSEAVTIRLPSGLNTAELTIEACPWRVATVLPESASRTRTVLSCEGDDPLAVGAERGGMDLEGVPLEGGEGFAGVGVPDPPVLSSEAVTTRLPSGLNAAELTYAVCPWRRARGLPESASQTRAVVSHEAVTIHLLSGLNAAVRT